MTEIAVRYGRGEYLLTAEGRAEACAAVSAVTQALAGFLRSYANGAHGVATALDLAPGSARIGALGDKFVEGAFRTADIGLRQIALAHPEQVRVRDASDPGDGDEDRYPTRRGNAARSEDT